MWSGIPHQRNKHCFACQIIAYVENGDEKNAEKRKENRMNLEKSVKSGEESLKSGRFFMFFGYGSPFKARKRNILPAKKAF